MTRRTEKEKMLAGERYNFFDSDLAAEREKAKELLRLYNGSENVAERRTILEELLGGIGESSIIEPPFRCIYGQSTHIGNHTYLNFHCAILDNGGVRIGDHVMVGPYVQIYTAAHPVQASPRIQGWETAKAIAIEDNVWIGGGAILLPGVTVGKNSVVGAGAVVTRSVPSDVIVAGNPARVIREIEQ